MPIYGDEKARHMAKSILPSTARKSSRRILNEIRRRNRHKTREMCRKLAADPELWDDLAEIRDYPNHEIHYQKWERRQADKLAHFERWAAHVTRSRPRDERLAAMRRILPSGLIGDHAIEHLRFMEEFASEAEVALKPWRYRRLTPTPRVKPDYAGMLKAVIEDNRNHKLLNRFLLRYHKRVQWIVGYKPTVSWVEKRGVLFDISYRRPHATPVYKRVGPEKPRLLLGVGDIPAFLEALSMRGVPRTLKVTPYVVRSYFRTSWRPDCTRAAISEQFRETRRNPDYHPEWFKALRVFLQMFRESRGDYQVLRRAVDKKTSLPL